MALQQPPLALRAGSAPALYIHSMPAWVLEDFCQKMDCLSDYDWMRFGEGTGQVGCPGRWRGRGAQGQQRLRDVLAGREVRVGFALSPPLPALGRAHPVSREFPGTSVVLFFKHRWNERQTSVAPWLFPGSQAPSSHSPQTFALPCPVTLDLLPLFHCLFSQRPSYLLRCSIFFLSSFSSCLFPHSFCPCFSRSWLCTVSKYRKCSP